MRPVFFITSILQSKTHSNDFQYDRQLILYGDRAALAPALCIKAGSLHDIYDSAWQMPAVARVSSSSRSLGEWASRLVAAVGLRLPSRWWHVPRPRRARPSSAHRGWRRRGFPVPHTVGAAACARPSSREARPRPAVGAAPHSCPPSSPGGHSGVVHNGSGHDMQATVGATVQLPGQVTAPSLPSSHWASLRCAHRHLAPLLAHHSITKFPGVWRVTSRLQKLGELGQVDSGAQGVSMLACRQGGWDQMLYSSWRAVGILWRGHIRLLTATVRITVGMLA